MNYGYLNIYITSVGEDVQKETEMLKKYADFINVDTLSSRQGLYEILDMMKKGDTLFVYNFERFCSGLTDLSVLLDEIVEEKQCRIVSLMDAYDSATPAGEAARAAYRRAIGLMLADPNYGAYK